MPGFMIYGQLQYYKYELTAWSRLTDFHRTELGELLVQLNIMLDFPIALLPDTKVANALVDQLIHHEQEFDSAKHHFNQQLHRVSNSNDPERLVPSIIAQQGRCRVKMKTVEAAFNKTKYECFVFLGYFFLPQSVAVVL
jgi:hypothetical protein